MEIEIAANHGRAAAPAPGLEAATLCEAFQRSAAAAPDALALRTPDGAVQLTWRDYANRVARVAAGLAALGVRRGDAVGAMLRNRPEFQLVDTAALHLGATPFSVYVTSPPEQIAHVLGNAGNRVLVVERAFLAQVEAAATTALEHVVVVDADPDAGGADGHMTLAQLEALGGAGLDLAEAARAVRPADVAALVYTSGTTGPPKGVELTHANLMFTLRALDARCGLRDGGRLVSYLPHAHLADRFSAHCVQLATGSTMTTVADPRTVMAALPTARPTIFLAVPRIWEKLRAAILADAQAVDGPTASPLAAAVELGLRRVRAEQGGGAVEPGLAAEWAAADRDVLAAVRERLGLGELDWALAGGAPIPEHVHEFFAAIGLPLWEAWGMTETSALHTLNDPAEQRIGSSGTTFPGTEMRIAADGELLVRGPNVMRGYRRDPERTAEALGADGWLHTGDVGELDADGHLRIVDRKKELIINAAGKNMSPANIEAAIKRESPLIGSAIAIGDGRPYNVALLTLDREAAAAFARRHALADDSVAAVVREQAARDEVAAAVARANERLARVEQIKRFALLAVESLPDSDELTATMKLKRRPIARKYARRIDALYGADQAAA